MNLKPLALASIFVAAASAASGADTTSAIPANWPAPPHELEQRFASQDFKIREVKGAGGGVTGASKLLLEYPDGKTIKVKWKAVPDKKADGWNNSPRKELAVYELQRWIVDEPDFIVPTSAPHCIPLADYESVRAHAKPNIPGARCELGILSVWMEHVDAPADFYDKTLFKRDEKYANYLSDFNLLLYLADHRDGRRGNLLISEDEHDRRVFAVDNGIAFDPFPWNMWVKNWYKIRVPWLRKASVDKLRTLTAADYDKLGVVSELALDKDGILRVVPNGPNLNPNKGARITANRVQFGLDRDEIGDLKERVRNLLKDVDKGEIKLR